MDILIICPFYPPNLGGVETHLQLLTDYLLKKKYKITVLTYSPLVTPIKAPLIERNKDLSIYRCPWIKGKLFDSLTPYPPLQFLYIVPGLLIYSLVWMALNHKKINLIHAHGFAAAFISRIIKIFFNKKFLISTHFIYKKLNRKNLYSKLFHWVFAGADFIFPISQTSKQELIKTGLPSSKMTPFKHWLDLTKIKPQDKQKTRLKLKIPSQYKQIYLYAGRILKMKGVFTLLKVAKKMPPDTLFLLLGDGPHFSQLKSKAKNIKNFKILGRKSNKQVFDYLAASDLFLLPSLAEEAQPMTIMEAISAGRPVIITNKGSAKEMVNNRVAVVIEPTLRSLYNALMDFYKNPNKLKKMTTATRPFALKHFSQKNAHIITSKYHD